MTMLAHTLKDILSLIPESTPLIKKASVDQEFPLDNKDSVLATALQIKYFEKVANHSVDPFLMEKVSKAVTIYGLNSELRDLSDKMVKAAKYKAIQNSVDHKAEYLAKQASFISECSSISEKSQKATELYKQAKDLGIEPSEDVIRYSGNGYLNKEAAVKALYVRFSETGDDDFVKVAKVIVESKSDPRLKDSNNLVKLANFIDTFDKDNGLQFKGFDIYKEIFFTKEAAFKDSIMIKLAGSNIPYNSIERVGHTRIASYMGKDIADEMNHGPENFKAVAETLPLDLQRMLVSLTKNV